MTPALFPIKRRALSNRLIYWPEARTTTIWIQFQGTEAKPSLNADTTHLFPSQAASSGSSGDEMGGLDSLQRSGGSVSTRLQQRLQQQQQQQ